MKKHNERLLSRTQKLSSDTLKKSIYTVDKLTHPSPQVRKIGSAIGKTVGVGLFIAGTVGTIYGSLWGIAGCVVGVCTVVSNTIKVKQ